MQGYKLDVDPHSSTPASRDVVYICDVVNLQTPASLRTWLLKLQKFQRLTMCGGLMTEHLLKETILWRVRMSLCSPFTSSLRYCFWNCFFLGTFLFSSSSPVMTSLPNANKKSGEKAPAQPSWMHFFLHTWLGTKRQVMSQSTRLLGVNSQHIYRMLFQDALDLHSQQPLYRYYYCSYVVHHESEIQGCLSSERWLIEGRARPGPWAKPPHSTSNPGVYTLFQCLSTDMLRMC